MELRCDQTNKKAPPILDTTPSQDGTMMDLDQRPPEADLHLQHSHPSPAPVHSSTAPPSAHHSPIPAPHQKPTLPPISGRPSPPASSRSREYSLPAQTPTTNGHRTNGPQLAYPSPSPQDVSMDALSRLQTQVQYNTAGLTTQRRGFEALSHAVGRLSDDMVRIESLVPSSSIDEAVIETFASNLTSVANKQQYPAATPTTFVPFTSTEQPHSEDNWQSEAHHGPSSAGKESRRGRGGGRGRGRRSLPADTRELGTPEWEKPGYQTGPEGYYHMDKLPRGGNIVRRGSGGNGPIAMRPIEMTRPTTSGDPYAHTKKTRTKPIRNADGILIRKDGQPDMRSQSSAANLRKVHARKEQERILEQRANTPSSSLATAPMSNNSRNGSQTAESTPDKENAPANDKDRHEAIMKQMFPNGVDDQVNRRNFHDQFFPGGTSPTVAKVKPEVTSPSERSVSEVEERVERRSQVNGHTQSPTADAHEADKMDLSQDHAPQPVSQAA
ncbi:hypothetical protein UCDDS831_g01737 [Diplodia seriata]|uniref:Uncharacterized protein n=1 Tax=Diplodia seriata TaxID=420778 RepID=A0A0G2EVU1_9PEZI|nr:hypothetical protein UCDDS831_g01737 [Diplodia seriata]